jgi:hypothetical protein
VGEAEAAVGHILPLVFVLLEEEYEVGEELQLLGYLAWAHAAAAPGFARHVAWHVGIQMAVFTRCLKVGGWVGGWVWRGKGGGGDCMM